MKERKNGVTLMELLVVLLIIGILSTIAVGIYTQQIERARITAAKDTIYQLEVAAKTYEIDVGELPPSGSGTIPGITASGTGSGYLQLALSSSLNGNALSPLDTRWFGPYIEIDINKLGDINGNPISASLSLGSVNILDPWKTPYYYVKNDDYASFGTERASSDPYRNTETYYNPSTFQIFSFGPNRQTLSIPQRGTETDDINNWGYTLALDS
jgi:prepilin-type N-terminal cleavage/methylation domain-containing protein